MDWKDRERVLSKIVATGVTPEDAFEAVVLVVHGYFVSRDCVLLGFSEDAKEEVSEWSEMAWRASRDLYTLKYRWSDKHVLVKVLRMGRTMHVNAAAMAPESTLHTWQLVPHDQIRPGASLEDVLTLYKDLDALLILIHERIGKLVIPESVAPAEPVMPPPPDFDPLRDYFGPRPLGTPPVPGLPRGGDFDQDLFAGGLRDPFGAGGLMGPRHPIFGDQGRGRGAARFDPFNPAGIPGEPDYDDFPPPGPRAPFMPGRRGRRGGGFGGGFGGQPPFL